MHGKKRAEYKAQQRNPKVAAALMAKAEQWHTLMLELQSRRRCDANDDSATSTTTLALLEKALLVNPDPLNLWNHRREVLLTTMKDEEDDNNNNNGNPKVLETERALTQAALQRNPKSYGAWFHRKWILQTIKPSESILQEELALTALFLSLDERNFHCWNYRRFVVACLAGNWSGEWNMNNNNNNNNESSSTSLIGPQVLPSTTNNTTTATAVVIPHDLLQSELDFTSAKIKDNFSNFSAFHYRSQLLDYVMSSDAKKEPVYLNEFQLIEDAICTEPDDQTAWWYHAILLDKLLQSDSHENNGLSAALHAKMEEQADLLRELLEDSPGCKWILLGLLRVLPLLKKDREESNSEQKELLERLIQVDPDRAGRYQALLEQL